MSNSNLSPRLIGHLFACGTALVWGSTFICSKVLLEFYSPVQIMVMRFVLGYVFLWILRPKRLPFIWKQELRFLAMGILGCTLYFWAENTALTYTLAANVSIIVAMAPILTSVLAHFFTKDEKLHASIWYGFILAFLGVALVVFNGTVILKLNPLGDFLSFGAALTWACYSLLLKSCTGKFDSIVLARRVNFYGILTAIPLLFTEGAGKIPLGPLLQPKVIASIVFLGLLGSALCYVSWNIVVKNLGVVTANNYIYLQPFITMVIAALLLGEAISWMGIIGAVLIIGGVILASFPHHSKAGAACQNKQNASQ